MLMWAMSDRAIPRSFRMMEGFGVHTFRLVNEEGKSTFVKFHWRPKLVMQSVVWDEALKISGADPDFHRRDLWNAIESRRLPGVGTSGSSSSIRSLPTSSISTCWMPPNSFRKKSSRLRIVGTTGAGPECGQLLRGDRAGGVLRAERRAGNRLHERSPAAGAHLLLSRHAAQAAGRTKLPADSRSTRRSAR